MTTNNSTNLTTCHEMGIYAFIYPWACDLGIIIWALLQKWGSKTTQLNDTKSQVSNAADSSISSVHFVKTASGHLPFASILSQKKVRHPLRRASGSVGVIHNRVEKGGIQAIAKLGSFKQEEEWEEYSVADDFCRFMELPRELRDEIYKFAMDDLPSRFPDKEGNETVQNGLLPADVAIPMLY